MIIYNSSEGGNEEGLGYRRLSLLAMLWNSNYVAPHHRHGMVDVCPTFLESLGAAKTYTWAKKWAGGSMAGSSHEPRPQKWKLKKNATYDQARQIKWNGVE